ncbi:hypothetical protein EUTSA_v10005544mg [Eutrema salsugineum]|uniref:X8 domain-containing protein n=1 Tax=Eutrema salsugineum TaxID=72664 RepID=V4KNS1_EUTSA|nr:major pollen allergen Ole e 10 [Eutrema salsugineum]ESQ31582.1 hypothetical protein EUTSA_v10005544mg [Eutrema salsugineum]
MVTVTTMSLSSTTLVFFLIVSTVSGTSATRNLSLAAENSGEWCVANNKATDAQLQATIDWCCSDAGGFRDCGPIQPGGACYEPNTLRDHASYVMNEYYQNLGHTGEQCDFGGTGTRVHRNPSHGSCVYVSY